MMSLSMMLSGASGGGPPTGSFWVDTFIGAANDPISTHTANTGGGYTQITGSAEMKLDGVGGLYDFAGTVVTWQNNAQPLIDDYTITADFKYVTASFDAGIGYGGRCQIVGGNLQGLIINANPGANNFRLLEFSGGGVSIIDTLSHTFSAPETITSSLAFSGSNVTMTINGSTNGAKTTAVTSGGKGAVRGAGSSAAATTGIHVANINGAY